MIEWYDGLHAMLAKRVDDALERCSIQLEHVAQPAMPHDTPSPTFVALAPVALAPNSSAPTPDAPDALAPAPDAPAPAPIRLTPGLADPTRTLSSLLRSARMGEVFQ